MSDYEVTLVNDNMQEFYVRFKGPEESTSYFYLPSLDKMGYSEEGQRADSNSTIRRRILEDPRRAAG